jgi:hypothetical protein
MWSASLPNAAQKTPLGRAPTPEFHAAMSRQSIDWLLDGILSGSWNPLGKPL